MSDRIKRSIEAVVEALLGPRIDRCALYPARVVAQGADGSLDVVPDHSELLPSMTKVGLRTPVPGATVKVQPGARVLIGWDVVGTGAYRPYASLWESGATLELVINADTKVRLSAPTIEIDGSASVVLAGGILPVARQTDPVTAGPYAGTIQSGAPKVKA